MREQYRASLVYFILAVILFHVAHVTFTCHQPIIFRNEQEQVVGVYDLTVLFQVVAWSALVIGSLLLVAAIRRWRRRDPYQGQPELSFLRFGRRLFMEGPFWIVINTGLILLSFWTGYAEMSANNLQRTNPDILLCISILVVIPLFVIGSVSLARIGRLRTPAWNRFPLNWKGDPLQALFIMTLCALAALIGSLFRLASPGNSAVWMVATHASLLLGLLIGQAIVYRVFRFQIGQSEEPEGTN